MEAPAEEVLEMAKFLGRAGYIKEATITAVRRWCKRATAASRREKRRQRNGARLTVKRCAASVAGTGRRKIVVNAWLVAMAVLAVWCISWSISPDSRADANFVRPFREVAKVNDEIEKAKQGLLESQEDLAQIISNALHFAGSEEWSEERVAVEGLILYSRRLRSFGEMILAERKRYMETIESYRATLGKAPKAFRQAAKQFEEYAAEEPYEDLAAEYLSVARTWNGMATLIERRSAAIGELLGPNDQEVGQVFDFAERTLLFLERYEPTLSVLYPELGPTAPTADYLKQLQEYGKQFEQLRSLIRQMEACVVAAAGEEQTAIDKQNVEPVKAAPAE